MVCMKNSVTVIVIMSPQIKTDRTTSGRYMEVFLGSDRSINCVDDYHNRNAVVEQTDSRLQFPQSIGQWQLHFCSCLYAICDVDDGITISPNRSKKILQSNGRSRTDRLVFSQFAISDETATRLPAKQKHVTEMHAAEQHEQEAAGENTNCEFSMVAGFCGKNERTNLWKG